MTSILKNYKSLMQVERLDFASTCISENSWIFICWKYSVLLDS